MALIISDTLSGFAHSTITAHPSIFPFAVHVSGLIDTAITADIKVDTDGNGAFVLLLPWPSETTPSTLTWTIHLPDGTTASGAVPNNVAGPLTLAQLKSTYGWTRTVYVAPAVPSSRGVYLPNGWNTAWRAALASAGNSIVPVAFIGDSITRGHSVTARSGKHWMAQTIAALQAQYGSAGDGFHHISDTLDSSAGSSSPGGAYAPSGYSAEVTPTWAYSGTWADDQLYGLAGQARRTTTAGSTATATFTGVAAELHINAFSGGNAAGYSVAIDGGAATNYSSFNASSTGVLTRQAVASGLTNGSHTALVSYLAGTFMLYGITALNGGNGILPYRLGVSGRSARTTLLDTHIDSAKAMVENWPRPPKLVIFAHSVNDMQEGNAYGLFEDLVARIGASCENTGASLLFLIPAIGPYASGSGNNWTNAQYAHRYIDVIYRLARRYTAAVLDINTIWEGLGYAAGNAVYAASNNSHPGDSGHADIAGRLASVIL